MNDLQRFTFIQSIFLLFTAAVLWVFFPVGGALDLSLIEPWMNETGNFPLRYDWALAVLNHSWVKTLLIAAYMLILLQWLATFKIDRMKAQRFELGYFFAAAMLCTIIVGILKSQSAHACPWNMTLPAPHGFLWEFKAEHGHCFPGGHASTGFAFMTGYFAYRLSQPKRAYFFLCTGFILGFAMGWAQMMRGAHFLSHNLWTAWVVWCINVVVYALCYKRISAQKTNRVPSANVETSILPQV
ncbi:phosphatase PAP2 family protein [Acinetobacter sp. ANC 3813]|uniref:phosphatase PAP2 family protein n=1 Tax=Acinetobacter sp. ANC 3813 TaxID=1977873 RepID=UPI000A34612B|nr:phosphatase PAP2 family protein [Acinetobacter sp. ANC 3813]OTG92079.1 hypothetical protein B9T34_01710 [Acinetobacter sp. ANC 3813]